MKNIIIISVLSICAQMFVFSQTITGQFIELTKNKDEIKVPNFGHATLTIESEVEKIRKGDDFNIYPYVVETDSNGAFIVDTLKIKGEKYTLYFYDMDYAYLVLKNIPKKRLGDILRIIPIVKIIWKPTCGHDCLTIDPNKTYKRKKLIVRQADSEVEFIRKENKSVPSKIFQEIWAFDGKYYYEYEYKD